MSKIEAFKRKYPVHYELRCSNCDTLILLYVGSHIKAKYEILICDKCKQDLEYYKNKVNEINKTNNADFNSIFGNIFRGEE